jgi:molybdate transport system regulatory protein
MLLLAAYLESKTAHNLPGREARGLNKPFGHPSSTPIFGYIRMILCGALRREPSRSRRRGYPRQPGYYRDMTIPPDRPELHVRLVWGSSIVVGPGKADLLAAIAETGSITAAGRAMGMSYKRAWYLLDTMSRCFREPLIHATKGGKGFGGACLTPMGTRVLALYRAIEKQAAAGAAAELASLLELVVETPPEPGGRKSRAEL